MDNAESSNHRIAYILYEFRIFGENEEAGKEEAREAARYYDTISNKPSSVIINLLMNKLREKTKLKYKDSIYYKDKKVKKYVDKQLDKMKDIKNSLEIHQFLTHNIELTINFVEPESGIRGNTPEVFTSFISKIVNDEIKEYVQPDLGKRKTKRRKLHDDDDDDDDVPNITPVAVEESKNNKMFINGIPVINDPYGDSNRVYLAASKLGPNVGLGLFAKIDFKKDDDICAYIGDRVPTERYEEFDSDYRLEYNKTWTIDSTDPHSCYGRYPNDPILINLVNAKLSKRMKKIEAFVKATKSIKAGDEILVAYGDEYWKSKKFFMLSTNLQRVILNRNNSEYKEIINKLKPKIGGKLH